MIIKERISIPIYYFSFEIWYGNSYEDFQESQPDVAKRLSIGSEGLTIEEGNNITVILTALSSGRTILHEAIHVYSSLLESRGMNNILDTRNDEGHAYLLSYVQQEMLDKVLEMRSRFLFNKKTEKKVK
jgi:hypothetical protein